MSIKLSKKISLDKGNSKLFKLRARSSSKGDNCKNGIGSFKNVPKNHRARRAHTYMKAFWYLY
jgi:hypothetical protein